MCSSEMSIRGILQWTMWLAFTSSIVDFEVCKEQYLHTQNKYKLLAVKLQIMSSYQMANPIVHDVLKQAKQEVRK